MKLYNSLTKRLEVFTPIQENKVTLYSCGPTVYNNLHIGNLSAFIYADVLKRTLQIHGYSVTHAMNITDVDDKTIRDSAKDYPKLTPMQALLKLTSKYTKIFLDDLKATGNNTGDIAFISAVETIPEMIELTQKLIDVGIAYHSDDGIYFSIENYTSSGHKYGVLQQVELGKSHSRIAQDEYDKESASDFALWKASSPGEPSWDAVFLIKDKKVKVTGRPGWHIECSAMSEKILKVPFDIHTGGIDLKFPHHENEIAQSCGVGSDKLANYFVHNNHILVDGRKMSKSLGNFYTLRDIELKGYSPQDFRMLVLESHYRSESNFSWEILNAAQNRRRNLLAIADLRWQASKNAKSLDNEYFENKKANIAQALADDLSTPHTLMIISELVSDFERGGLNSSNVLQFNYLLLFIEDSLGITTMTRDITDDQKSILNEREQARSHKDWKLSDTLRDKLATEKIEVRDMPFGQIWSRQ